jgi:hypothetical protein
MSDELDGIWIEESSKDEELTKLREAVKEAREIIKELTYKEITDKKLRSWGEVVFAAEEWLEKWGTE